VGYSENIRKLEEITPRLIDADIFFNLFQYVNDLIAVVNDKGYFVYINDKWEKLLGYSKDELVSHPLVEFTHPEDIKSTEDLFRKMSLDKIDVESFIARYKRKNDGYVKLCWSSSPFINGLSYGIARRSI
jgi:PAS domain S-box-containing protein